MPLGALAEPAPGARSRSTRRASSRGRTPALPGRRRGLSEQEHLVQQVLPPRCSWSAGAQIRPPGERLSASRHRAPLALRPGEGQPAAQALRSLRERARKRIRAQLAVAAVGWLQRGLITPRVPPWDSLIRRWLLRAAAGLRGRLRRRARLGTPERVPMRRELRVGAGRRAAAAVGTGGVGRRTPRHREQRLQQELHGCDQRQDEGACMSASHGFGSTSGSARRPDGACNLAE